MKRRFLSYAILPLVLFGTAICQDNQKDTVQLTAEVADGQVISKVDPMYPPMARIAHIQGDVVLTAIIDKNGKIKNLKLVSGHPILASAAMDAVKQWKYKPWLLNGEPVAVETTVTVRFHMSPTKAQAEAELNRPFVPPPDPSSPSSVPRKLGVSSDIAASHLIHQVDPVYPEEARRDQIQGNVVLRILIDEKGNVDTVDVISGHPLLAESAQEAVKQWTYTPWLLNGEPVEVKTVVTVVFHL